MSFVGCATLLVPDAWYDRGVKVCLVFDETVSENDGAINLNQKSSKIDHIFSQTFLFWGGEEGYLVAMGFITGVAFFNILKIKLLGEE